MLPLRFHLLGQAQIEVGEEALSGFVSAKAQALLIYLAMSPGRHTRNRLANLLWREFSDEQARNNLRTTLSNLNGLVGPHLTIERDAVSYNRKQPYWLDVDIVRTTFDSPWTAKSCSAGRRHPLSTEAGCWKAFPYATHRFSRIGCLRSGNISTGWFCVG